MKKLFSFISFTTMKKLFSFILMALLPVVASAYSEVDNYEISGYDAKVDGFYYKFSSSSEDEAMVSYVKYRALSYYNQNGEYNDASTYISDYSGEVVIPESFTYEGKTYRVTGINEYAFFNCKGITSITIPGSVTKIGKEFIKGCSGLTDIYCLSENAPDATNAFSYSSISNITLHVPEGSEEQYKATMPWSYFFAVLPDGSIEINETNFPDRSFRKWLSELSIGLDGVLTEEEMASVKTIDLRYGEYYPMCLSETIYNLKGIEYFTELTKLLFDGINLKELDLTKNTKLKEFNGYSYTLKKLNVSGCSELKALDCAGNPLTELDVSGCTSLTGLYCNNSQLIELNASGCTSLTSLECEANNLTMLDVSGCTALTHLKYWKNKIKGAGMDALIESLPTTNSGSLYAFWVDSRIHDQNVMSFRQVAAAKAKGWKVRSYEYGNMADYTGVEVTEVINFTQDQMATIILPTAPDASKGKYYKLDRCEGGMIVFAQELQPQARTPYIIVPSEDFSINLGTLDLTGLTQDAVSIEGVSFIGSYTTEELNEAEGFYINLIDTTPDCWTEAGGSFVIGALHAYLQVNWDDPFSQDGTRAPREKMEVVLLDEGDGIDEIRDSEFNIRDGEGSAIYDMSGRKLFGKPTNGIYIVDGKKVAIR